MQSREHGFFSSFIALTNREIAVNKVDPCFIKFQARHADARLIEEASELYTRFVLKPQLPLITGDDYYCAIDMLTNTYYLCMEDVVMIDIDEYDGVTKDVASLLPSCLCQVRQVMSTWGDSDDAAEFRPRWQDKTCACDVKARYRIYRSRSGYHCFLMNSRLNHASLVAMQLQCEARCDYLYSCFCYIRGFCVRLNRKPGEKECKYSLVGDVVEGKIIPACDAECDARCVNLVNLHLELCEVFKDTEIPPLRK